MFSLLIISLSKHLAVIKEYNEENHVLNRSKIIHNTLHKIIIK